MHTCMCVYIYIYIERERERERDMYVYICNALEACDDPCDHKALCSHALVAFLVFLCAIPLIESDVINLLTCHVRHSRFIIAHSTW